MADPFADLLESAEDYLTHLNGVGADDIGDVEDKLWVTLVRARNAFLAAKDEKEMGR